MTRAHRIYKATLDRMKLYGLVFVAIGLMCAQLAYVQSLNKIVEMTEARTAQTNRELAEYRASHCVGREKIQTHAAAAYSVNSAGHERTYHVHVPDSYNPSNRYPVIVNYDGIDGGGLKMEGYSNVDSLPVIAVYPDSLMGTSGFTAWQGAPYSLAGDYDVQFTKAMMNEVKQQYCVDDAKVFGIGMSNGGGFVVIANCQLPGMFKAIASLSGAYYTGCEGASKPSGSLLALHSATDPRVPFQGSTTKGVPAVTEWAGLQAKARACQKAAKNSDVYGTERYDWTGCNEGTKVRLIVLQNQPHGWLAPPYTQASEAPNTAGYIWSFFKESMRAK